MEEIKHKTWNDVGTPKNLIQQIQQTSFPRVLDLLVMDRVFHQPRRLIYTYNCNVCGYVHNCQRTYEEMHVCIRCNSRAIRSTQIIKFSKDRHLPYSSEEQYVDIILRKMRENYCLYYGVEFEDVVSLGWRPNSERSIFCQFQGGEEVLASTPTLAVAKAAVLVPFLWDDTYVWQEGFFDKGRETHLTPLIFQIWKNRAEKDSLRRKGPEAILGIPPPPPVDLPFGIDPIEAVAT